MDIVPDDWDLTGLGEPLDDERLHLDEVRAATCTRILDEIAAQRVRRERARAA